MTDRAAICRRHGLSEAVAADLHGETPEELEADAAARAAIAAMFRPKTLAEAERAVEPAAPADTPGLPPADKQFADYTPEEWEATRLHYEQRRVHQEQLERDRVEREEQDPVLRLVGIKTAIDRPILDAIHRLPEEEEE